MNMTRRSFLGGSLGWAALLLASCGSASSASSASSAPATSASHSASPSPSGSASSQPAASAAPSVKAAVPGTANAVKGAWVAITANQMIWPLALEAGYFEKYGVNFTLEYVQGSLTAVQALLAHDLQMIQVAGSAIVAAQASKTDLVMSAGYLSDAIWRVMAPPSITSVDQVKGKAVAVTKVGNADYFAWAILAERQGWPEDSFKYVAANNPPGQITLLQRGDVVAAAVSPPNDVLAEEKGGAHLLLDEATFHIAEQQSGVAQLRSYVAQNRQTVLSVLKATVEAIHRWKTDPAFAKGVIKKYLKQNDQKYIDDGYSAYATLFNQVPFPSKDGFARVIKEVATQRPAAANVTPDQCMELTLVKELQDSGFIKQIYGR